MENIEALRKDFLSHVAIDKISLKNRPNYIFFCGGGINNNELFHIDTTSNTQVKSLRSAILHYFRTKEKELYQDIILAEEFHDWLEDANINNLIDFEILLAGLAVAVVLIVEGPGAHAELGAFSVIPEISSKLITIYNARDIIDGQKTFIEWGPVKYLEKNNSEVLRHEWVVNYQIEENRISQKIENDHNLQSLVDLIGTQLTERISEKSKKTSNFSSSSHSDLCLLVADLIYVFSALKLREIKGYISSLLKSDLNEKTLKEYLYSLKKLEIIREVNAGSKYYLPTDKNQGFIKYQFNKDSEEDLNLSASSIKSRLMQMYFSSDKERTYAMGVNN